MISNWEFILRICLSALLASLIGFERERTVWVAGLRTHMLVGVGACLIMLTSAYGFSEILADKNISFDPSRMAAQVVSGIGFLGAGAILLRGNIIRGLTTAASIWIVAGIGLAVGAGLYTGSIFTTLIILVILTVLRPLEMKIKQAKLGCEIQLQMRHGQLSAEIIKKMMGKNIIHLKEFIIKADDSSHYDDISIQLVNIDRSKVFDLVNQLRQLDKEGLNKKINVQFKKGVYL